MSIWSRWGFLSFLGVGLGLALLLSPLGLHGEGFTFADVAALLHQPARTIRTRYRRARLLLRESLQLGEPVP